MPLYRLDCMNGHTAEHHCHTPDDRGAETRLCVECGESMVYGLSLGVGLCWFEESKPRVLWNLGPEPITVTSHGQHRQLMREHQVEWSTKWPTQKTGGWV